MSIRALPSMEHTFSIKAKGSETGEVFEGTFTYCRPNIRSNSNIGKTLAMLNGGIKALDEDTAFLHKVFAELKHTLVKYPEWWEKSDFGFELYDLNIVLEVYNECGKFEKKWIDEVYHNKKEEDGKDKK